MLQGLLDIDVASPVGACPTASAFLARTSGLDATHIAAYNGLICGLVSDGIWTKLDLLHIYATQDSTTAVLNLVSTSYNGTANGGITFTTDRGYTGTDLSATKYIDTHFVPNVGGTQHSRDSAHFSAWSVTDVNSARAIMGIDNGATSESDIFPRNANTAYFRMNSTAIAGVANTDATGHYVSNRSTSLAIQGYRNGSSIFTNNAIASQALLNNAVNTAGVRHVFSTSNEGCAGQIAMASIGSSLSAGDVTNFYNRLRTYMTAVGVP